MFRLESVQKKTTARSLIFRSARAALPPGSDSPVAEILDDYKNLTLFAREGEQVWVNNEAVQQRVLKDGDCLQIGEEAWTVFRVIPPVPFARRRGSPMRKLTACLLALAAIGQFAFLYWISSQWDASSFVPPSPSPGNPKATPPIPKPSVPKPPSSSVASRTDAPQSRPPPPPITPAKVEEPKPAPPTKEVNPPSPVVQTTTNPLPAPSLPVQDPSEVELQIALNALDKGDYFSAERTLMRLIRTNPNYTPAYETMARVMEKQARFLEAVGQWRKVLALNPAPDTAARAREEEARLVRMQALLDESSRLAEERRTKPLPPLVVAEESPPPKPSAQPSKPLGTASVKPTPRPTVSEAPSFQIVSSGTKRMPNSDQYEDMRLIDISLLHAFASRPAKGSDVQIHLTIYDRDAGTDNVYASQVPVTREPRTLPAEIQPNQKIGIQYAYVVPIGFRSRQARRSGQSLSYHGFVLEVYYQGHLQGRVAYPENLLNR